MANSQDQVTPYSSEDESKKVQVQKMFDNIAPHYDLLNRVLSAGRDQAWRRRAIARLRPDPEIDKPHLLDVATGTGDLAFEIHRQFPTASIVGLDIADKMLDVARRKSANRQKEHILEFVLGDSENLPFESNSFDGVSVAFGVRNFGDLDVGLREIHRVLKPGSRFVVLEFTRPRSFPFKQLFGAYFKHILPRIGGLSSGDRRAYQYLYESVQAFPDYDDFAAVLRKNGFSNTSFEVLSLGICAIYTAEK